MLVERIMTEAKKIEKESRNYLGASLIGHACNRYIWYSYNDFERDDIDVKTQLVFDSGKALEAVLIDYIVKSSLPDEIIYKPTKIFSDKEITSFKGNPDLIIENPNGSLVVEIKTANGVNFRSLQKKGCRQWRYQYFCQIQCYMGFTEIHKASILVMNKDTCELYEEEIEFDEMLFESIRNKAKEIIDSDHEPDRINSCADYYVCKFCDFKKYCYSY